VERAKTNWTDARIDDMARRMDDGFNRVDEDIRALRVEMSARFEAMQSRTDAHFDSLQRAMLQLGGGMIVTFVVGFASLLAAQLA
jgi:rhamnose utilization protein RhaD (predicted bifunctional aldolase and dehydrogenase)